MPIGLRSNFLPGIVAVSLLVTVGVLVTAVISRRAQASRRSVARGLAVVSLLAIVVATVTPCSARTAHGAVLLVALAVSVSIETIQFLALSRIASTDDVILNVGDSVVGACLGSSIAHSGWGLGRAGTDASDASPDDGAGGAKL